MCESIKNTKNKKIFIDRKYNLKIPRIYLLNQKFQQQQQKERTKKEKKEKKHRDK
jgi:hypothetical protein